MPLTRITLTSRRSIALSEVRMSATYDGMMEGYPHRRVNEFLVESRVRAAREEYPSLPVHLVRPALTYPDALAGPSGPVEELPAVACIGAFESHEIDPANDDGWHFSSLVVVWFQPTPRLPPEYDADHLLRDLPWEELARDYEH